MCQTDFDYYWDVAETSVRKARKPHHCCQCGAPIPVGCSYEYGFFVGGGDWDQTRAHLECNELRDFIRDVMCGGHGEIPYGELAIEIDEHVSLVDLRPLLNEIAVAYGGEPVWDETEMS